MNQNSRLRLTENGLERRKASTEMKPTTSSR
jgi:hypothetical protein